MSTNYHYNPALLTDEALREQFVVRTSLLDTLINALKAPRSGHHIVIGPRGMGKTTLLRRIHLGIRDDPTLSNRWLPLAFPEEQYNVASLADFWANCADALADSFERVGRADVAAALDARVDRLDHHDPGAALELLVDAVRREGRGLVLLVDNLDIVLARLDEREQWELRAVLGGELPLALIGASADLQGETAQYGKPFYEFLQVHSLGALTLEEIHALLGALAQRAGPDARAQLARVPAGRIRALHTLTGGNPRTAGLLFEILVADPTTDAEGAINALLDRVTPLYKDRFESLPEQLQRVLDAVALHWHPATAADIAARVDLPVNHTSAALQRLMQLAVVEQVSLPDTKRAGFQVAERFFNVWYLMRASRRLRRKLSHLVRFMEAFWSNDERQDLIQRLLDGVADLETSLAVAQTQGVREEAVARALVLKCLRALDGRAEALGDRVAELIEPGASGLILRDSLGREATVRRTKQLIFEAKVDWAEAGTTAEDLWRALSRSLITWEEKLSVAQESISNPSHLKEVGALIQGAGALEDAIEERVGTHVRERILGAAADGTLNGERDWTGGRTALAAGNPWPVLFICNLEKVHEAPSAALALGLTDVRRFACPKAAAFLAKRAELARAGEIAFSAAALVLRYSGGAVEEEVGAWILAREFGEAMATVIRAIPSETQAAWLIMISAAGGARQVLAYLEQHDQLEIALPLVEALRADIAGDRSGLFALAPELRQPAEASLAEIERQRTILEPKLDGWRRLKPTAPPPPPTPSKRRKAR